jgi:3-oxoacyl-[acyl-carrier-protein] synthase III
MPFSRIESIGAIQPQARLTTDEIMGGLVIPGKFKFELLTGIKSRQVCSPGEDSLSLAVNAAQCCLSHSGYLPAEIEGVISCSITRFKDGCNHFYEPSFSHFIRERIGATRALNFDVSNACAGMLTGIYIADTLIRQGVIKNCLIVSGEYISSLIHNAIKNIKNLASYELPSLTVGDAGAAVILEATEDKGAAISLSGFCSDTRYNDLCTARPRRRQPGASMKTKAGKIHDVSITQSVPVIKKALDSFELSYPDIDFLIPHQTSRSAILKGAKIYAHTFGGHPGEVVINLRNNGNTASTTHFLTLYRMLEDKRFKPDDRIVLLTFASGIVMGVLLFRPKHLLKRYGY